MESQEFNTGDVVFLRSGGLVMTVRTQEEGQVYCDFWNPYTHQMESGKYRPEQLVPYEGNVLINYGSDVKPYFVS